MKVIGLTGGIASGKSTASAYLRELGAAIVDADAISRASTRRGGAAFEAVCAAFGDILGADGEIDRRKLAVSCLPTRTRAASSIPSFIPR